MDKDLRKVYIRLDIDEGKNRHSKIRILGTKELPESAVRDAIEDTHESGLFRGGIYDEKVFEKTNRESSSITGIAVSSRCRSKSRSPGRAGQAGSTQYGIFIDVHVEEESGTGWGAMSLKGMTFSRVMKLSQSSSD